MMSVNSSFFYKKFVRFEFMYELTILTDFGAAHQIPGYPGKCCHLHGHNWQVEVTVAGDRVNELGMIIDFSILKEEVSRVIATLDHQMLNELEPFRQASPTSENIAIYIYDSLAVRPVLIAVTVQSVRVWESSRSSVLYRP
jgi:6-pyruvoyltetrahydropterin/6-carboxytetrahydropterin synthase